MTIILNIIHSLGFHIWKRDHDTGHNVYYECKMCGKRDVITPTGGYQPIDNEWLNNET